MRFGQCSSTSLTRSLSSRTPRTSRSAPVSPDDANGKNGDAYLDVTAGGWYAKASGSWAVQFTFELTDDQLHALSQLPALEARTADLAVENAYTWADTTDGGVALRANAAPQPWLGTAVFDDFYEFDAQDDAGNDRYIVLRIGINADVTEFRVQITRGAALSFYSGSAFHRIHASETAFRFYAHPNSHLKIGDELQVQKGSVSGEITEYRGHVGGATFDSTTFSGNLGVAVDTVQKLADALDALAVGGSIADDSIGPEKLVADSAAEKTAMRTRIGAGTSDFSGGYGDLSGTPTIPGRAICLEASRIVRSRRPSPETPRFQAVSAICLGASRIVRSHQASPETRSFHPVSAICRATWPTLRSLPRSRVIPSFQRRQPLPAYRRPTLANDKVWKTSSTGTPGWLDDATSATPGSGTDDQTASEVTVDATAFASNLSPTDTTVQTALATIDGLTLGAAATDDQDASEVPVTATGFTGNLSATDDDVQTALATIDALSLGSSAAAGYAYSAQLADIADIAAATVFANMTMGLTAGEQVDSGSGFTIETDAVTSRDQLVITNAGNYVVMASLIGDIDIQTTGSHRGGFRARLARTRGVTVTALAPEGLPTYARNAYGAGFVRMGSVISGVFAFEAGDKLEIQGLYENQTTTALFNLSGARSSLSVASTIGAGAVTGAQAANGGAGLTRIAEVELLASTLTLTEYGLNTAWGAIVQSTPIEFTGFSNDEIDRIEIGFNINAQFVKLVTITHQNIVQIQEMGITGISGTAATTIKGMYFSGRTISTTDSREPVEMSPKLGWMNERRVAGRYGVLIKIRQSDEGLVNGLLTYVSADTEIDAIWAYMIPRGAAV